MYIACRGYQWPLESVVPNTPGWKRIFDRRFEQVRIEDVARVGTSSME
jgi:hypothetical protein